MSLIEIPLFDGGLVTFADPEDIDKTAAVVSTNFDIDEPGKLVKRQGRGSAVTIAGDHIGQIVKWITQDLSASVWVYYETQSDKLRTCAAAFTGASDIKALHASTTNVQIHNFGRVLRFSNDIYQKPGIYHTIDRQFFFGNYDLSGGNKILDYDDAPPSLPTTWDVQNITEIGTGSRQSGFYYYQFVPVFDGVQEHPLTGDNFTSKEITNDNKTLRVGLKIDKGSSDYNPRITSVKVYRSFSDTVTGDIDPVYYHITTIPLNTRSTHEDNVSSGITVTPLDNQVWISGDLSTEPTDWSTSGNDNTRGIILGSSQTGTISPGSIEYNCSDQTWPGTSTGGLFNLTTSIGTNDRIFDGAYTIAVLEQGESNYLSGHNSDSGGYAGKNVLYQSAWNWYSGEAKGMVVYNTGGNAIDDVVLDSKEQWIKISVDTTHTSDFDINLTDGYRYDVNGDDITLWLYDQELTDKSLHPLGEATKVTVNHKYATYLGGRLFAGNVRLDPDADAEDHQDWIIYSELLQPDVLPITNYIQIKDTQGGQITGLTTHLGSLVVFMERGIYRLDVPSVDPSTFSLMESEENFGCIAPNSIVTIGGQTFFAGQDNAYVLDSGFNIYPITLPIKDIYQGKSNLEQSRFIYDPKKGRMLCRFGSDKQNIYVYDTNRSRAGQAIWGHMDLGATDVADLFAIDEDLKVFSVTNAA